MSRLSARTFFTLLSAAVFLTSGCFSIRIEDEKPKTETDEEKTYKGVSFFAANCLGVYYLWNQEIKGSLDNWLKKAPASDPIEKVKEIRFKQNGKDYDRWTEITDDFASFMGTIEGVTTTYGCDFTLKMLDSETVCAIVTVVYPGSPAEKAGISRGDVMVTFNGRPLKKKDYTDVIYNSFMYAPSCTVGLLDKDTMTAERSVYMTAVTMYENPVIHKSVFDIEGKKVAYLVFTAFTLKAIPDLIDACSWFKSEGAEELILDLRYNRGGYVTTEEVLASMLAPESAVNSGALFQKQVFNKELTEYYMEKTGENALNTFFKTSFTYEDNSVERTVSTADCNIGISKIHAIVTSSTASASESLLVGLMPYLDVEIIGEKTLGKFCSGITYGAEEWYDNYRSTLGATRYGYKEYVSNWGMYLMVGTYSDKDGNNPCRPDGLFPDIQIEDIPEYGFQWGDERDPMLRAALINAGMKELAAQTKAPAAPVLKKAEKQVVKSSFGKRILDI